MSLFTRFGQKHVQIATRWIGSGATFGALGGLGVIYGADWKLVLQYLPYYNGKYSQKD